MLLILFPLKLRLDLKKAVNSSDIIFVCVGTPNKKGSLAVDLSHVYKSIKKVISLTKN